MSLASDGLHRWLSVRINPANHHPLHLSVLRDHGLCGDKGGSGHDLVVLEQLGLD